MNEVNGVIGNELNIVLVDIDQYLKEITSCLTVLNIFNVGIHLND